MGDLFHQLQTQAIRIRPTICSEAPLSEPLLATFTVMHAPRPTSCPHPPPTPTPLLPSTTTPHPRRISPSGFPAPWAHHMVAKLLPDHLAEGREELDDHCLRHPDRSKTKSRDTMRRTLRVAGRGGADAMQTRCGSHGCVSEQRKKRCSRASRPAGRGGSGMSREWGHAGRG